MQLALMALGVISLLELVLWWRPVWRWHRPLACVLLVALSLVSGVFLFDYFSGWAVIVTVFSLYRMINLLRLIEKRIHVDHLYNTTRQTASWLIGMQLLAVVSGKLLAYNHVNILTCFYILSGIQLMASLVVLASTFRHLRTIRSARPQESYADRDLPDLTVAIPARNETTDLEECLRSLVASDYPKLEILVLDDCSQNKRTPEIIRDFAHDGVKFIAGEMPPEDWLAKNYAYAQLTEAANGELLLFCGVDCRFEPGSLSTLVKTMLSKKKSMASVLPRNLFTGSWDLKQLLIQPARYAWELALPRRLLQRPPVLSTCWLISRQFLESAGGFEAVSRKAVPESYFAHAAAARDDGYSFLRANSGLGLTSVKDFSEQRETAIRTRYPQLHRRPEIVALVGMSELLLLIWPLAMAVVASMTEHWVLVAISALCYLINSIVYSRIVNLTYRRFIPNGLWILPVAALYDIGLLNYSMWQYEFREVLWKGRNVCLPVMRVIPSLE